MPVFPIIDGNNPVWVKIPALEVGTNLDLFRSIGIFTAIDPINSPGAGTYFLICYNANIAGQRRTMQKTRNVATGEELSRTYDGLAWSAWA